MFTHLPSMPFTDADLPFDPETGRIYHLDISAEQLADDILIVGDPDRVASCAGRPSLAFHGSLADGDPLDRLAERIKAHSARMAEVDAMLEGQLAEVELDVCHRGLRTITGITREYGNRVTIVTSGMGTPSAEIALNEIHALRAIDFATRSQRPSFKPVHIIRAGTSGGLQEQTTLGTCMIAKYAVGLDNTGLFYDVPETPLLRELEDLVYQAITEATPKDARFRGKIHPYAAQTDELLFDAMIAQAEAMDILHAAGITVSSSGFFANQGRDISGVPPTIPDIDAVLAGIREFYDLKFGNMEMEASFLLHLMNALGHRAAAVSIAIANRRLNTFDHAYAENMMNCIKLVFATLHAARLSQ